MKRALLALSVVAMMTTPALGQITGMASVITNDRIVVDGQRVILYGIDALEQDQQCFQEGQLFDCYGVSYRQLEILVGNGPVSCEEVRQARFTYVVAKCRQGDVDISQAMVESGMALAFRSETDAYVAAEEAAKAAGLGIWKTEFAMPWEWRAMKSRPTNEP